MPGGASGKTPAREITQSFGGILPVGCRWGGGPNPATSCGTAMASAELCPGQHFSRRSQAQLLSGLPLLKANQEPFPLRDSSPGALVGGGIVPM